MASKILIVEDDPRLVRSLETALEREGFQVLSVAEGVGALAMIESDPPDFVILDLMLPRLGGIEVCQAVRANPLTAHIPIIVLSGKKEYEQRVQALNAGADDYLGKPFHMEELVARIRAVQRRSAVVPAEGVLRAGVIELDRERWTLTVEGKPVTLTPKEFGVLRALLEARGRVLTREYLLETVWGYRAAHDPDTRTVDVHVWRLRRKLGAARRYIITVRNVGYRCEIFLEWANLDSEKKRESHR